MIEFVKVMAANPVATGMYIMLLGIVHILLADLLDLILNK